MDSVEVRVRRGAALLDAELPGWWERVQVNELNMGRKCACVLGQLYPSTPGDWGAGVAPSYGYDVGRRELGIEPNHAAALLGFDAIGLYLDEDYTALAAEWTRVIESRRVSP